MTTSIIRRLEQARREQQRDLDQINRAIHLLKGRGHMSAAGRKAISRAQKARWAKRKKVA
jgi:hypothetical protein